MGNDQRLDSIDGETERSALTFQSGITALLEAAVDQQAGRTVEVKLMA
ncbi:hypothetical protein [Pseudomonas sp. ESBL1]